MLLIILFFPWIGCHFSALGLKKGISFRFLSPSRHTPIHNSREYPPPPGVTEWIVCSIQDCCFMWWQNFLRKITLNKNLFNILDSVNRNDDKLRTKVETVKPRAMNFLGKSRTRDRRHHCVISLFHTSLMDHSSWPISLTLSSKSCTCVKESYSSN